MAGIGVAELAIIAIIGFLVIGVPLVVVLFVFVLGKKRANDTRN